MKFSKYVSTAFALAGIILWLISQPEGNWAVVYFFMFAIALATLYAALLPGAMSFGRMISASISMIFILGMLAVAYRGSVEGKGIESIAAFIKPYPNITEVNALPIRPGSSTLQAWETKTPDSAAQVRKFYSDEAQYPGWELTSSIGTLNYRKPERSLEIAIHKRRDGAGIVYHLRKRTKR